MDATPYKVEKYCAACGNGLIATAAMCPQCGTATGRIAAAGSTGKGKDKAIAVLLAVFLSFFTYLYTWSVDKTRFVVSISVIGGILVLTVIALILEEVDYYWGGITLVPLVFYWLASLVFWIISLVRTVKRDSDFYANYGKYSEV
jgi:predicted RNA-binding Zn-ribbon protein involved in translation (DUF1610 family)